VVHIIAGLGLGGAETALVRLIRQSSPAGLRHTVISLAGRGDLADAIEAAGGTVLTPRSNSWPAFLGALLRAPARLRRLNPDVIQGWMVHGNLAAWFLRTFGYRQAGLAWNLRMTLTNIGHEKRRLMWMTRAIARLSRSVDLLIANSETGLRDHVAIGYRPRLALVIPNGFDTEVFAPDEHDRLRTRAAWRLPDNAVAFGLVGRCHLAKGHEMFIRAAARVQKKHPEAMFVFAGTGTDTNRSLDALLGTADLRTAFVLLGARNDIPSVMRGLDVVCVPSEYESFPNVLGEAMASARPCVATNVSDVAAIMGDAGRMIEVGDVEGLAVAMIEMVEMGAEGRATLGEAGRRRVLANYTLEHSTHCYMHQYSELARHRGRHLRTAEPA
jgi:glycosyltransferase involved in cell wall biosynthesis